MKRFDVGDKVKIANDTHIGAIPYQGKRGEVVKVVLDPPCGYDIRLEGEAISHYGRKS